MPGGWLGLWLGLLVTAGLVVALVVAWPEDDEAALAATGELTPTTWSFAPATPELPDLRGTPPEGAGEALRLFETGLPEAVAVLLQMAGQPQELEEIAVYPSYVIVTYRQGDSLFRARFGGGRELPGGPGGALELAALFPLSETDLARVPALVADAPSHHPIPTTVTHVLIDRFLPFDERVLVRVYVVPVDGPPTDGGYVSYTADGTLVGVCC